MRTEGFIESGYGAWGRLPHPIQRLVGMSSRWESPWENAGRSLVLARGHGRSYGDIGLNSEGVLLDMRRQDHFISFDPQIGILTCESGVQMGSIIDLVSPHGWFLPVTPGTQHATVGGAIANDVHGKNHHRAGTFGMHVIAMEIVRSDGRRLQCSLIENSEMFRATIGGMGLTGVITEATIALKRVDSPLIAVESQRFDTLEEFLAISAAADAGFEYTVAWVDAVGPGEKLGRGIFFRANHASAKEAAEAHLKPLASLSIPFEIPFALVNSTTVGFFNNHYFQHHKVSEKKIVAPTPFFYPLDRIRNWNRIYGPRGFFQYQCVVPLEGAHEKIKALLEIASASGWPSFLAVLKLFGKLPSAGCMSFPMEGITLALDFPNHGQPLLALFDRMDRFVLEAGGRVYAAKDARMSSKTFLSNRPELCDFMRQIDPGVTSDFWQRVMPHPRKTT